MLIGLANRSGAGTKYTSFQAAMVLQKMKVVEFLIDQPSVDMGVRSTDGKTTLIIATESKVCGLPLSACFPFVLRPVLFVGNSCSRLRGEG